MKKIHIVVYSSLITFQLVEDYRGKKQINQIIFKFQFRKYKSAVVVKVQK
jgi:hypothetical protein